MQNNIRTSLLEVSGALHATSLYNTFHSTRVIYWKRSNHRRHLPMTLHCDRLELTWWRQHTSTFNKHYKAPVAFERGIYLSAACPFFLLGSSGVPKRKLPTSWHHISDVSFSIYQCPSNQKHIDTSYCTKLPNNPHVDKQTDSVGQI